MTCALGSVEDLTEGALLRSNSHSMSSTYLKCTVFFFSFFVLHYFKNCGEVCVT